MMRVRRLVPQRRQSMSLVLLCRVSRCRPRRRPRSDVARPAPSRGRELRASVVARRGRGLDLRVRRRRQVCDAASACGVHSLRVAVQLSLLLVERIGGDSIPVCNVARTTAPRRVHRPSRARARSRDVAHASASRRADLVRISMLLHHPLLVLGLLILWDHLIGPHISRRRADVTRAAAAHREHLFLGRCLSPTRRRWGELVTWGSGNRLARLRGAPDVACASAPGRLLCRFQEEA